MQLKVTIDDLDLLAVVDVRGTGFWLIQQPDVVSTITPVMTGVGS